MFPSSQNNYNSMQNTMKFREKKIASTCFLSNPRKLETKIAAYKRKGMSFHLEGLVFHKQNSINVRNPKIRVHPEL